MHDTRMRDCVLVLDTSRDEFGGESWWPHYNKMHKINEWQVVVFWGTPAGRIGHYARLDTRYPIRKEIVAKNVEHSRFYHSSPARPQEYWIIRNEYQGYKYNCTVFEKFKVT